MTLGRSLQLQLLVVMFPFMATRWQVMTAEHEQSPTSPSVAGLAAFIHVICMRVGYSSPSNF